jgi:Kef-type K+ transport system membrane component KefB
MKIFEVTINRNFIGQVFVGIFTGFLIGMAISWINVFGHSGQAPLICAMAGGITSVGRLVKQQKELNRTNNS